MAIAINVSADVRQLEKRLGDLARKQLPFAAAMAITAVAEKVQAAEKKLILETFPTATPFTQNSVGITKARKSNLTARVFVRDKTAVYLEPYVTGGLHDLGGKRGLLVPKAARLNQYGNLPKGTVARLKGRPDIFIGPIRLKSGVTINGVWQRPTDSSRVTLLNDRRRRLTRLNKAENGKGHLKLLVRFEDPLPVKQRLEYLEAAEKVVRATLRTELAKALASALATAK